MEVRPIKRLLKRALLITAVFVVSGYVASVLSIGQCESLIGDRIAVDIGMRSVFVLPGTSNYAENRVKRAGFVTQKCGQNGDCFPWVELVGLPSRWPFMASVSWGYVAVPLGGQGNRTTFLCFFGLVIELSEQARWAT